MGMQEFGNESIRAGKEHYRSGEHSLSKTDYQKILMVCGTIEDEVMMRLAITTGARRDDLAHMTWADTDLDLGILSYAQKKKGGKILHVKLGNNLLSLLNRYKRTCPKRQKYILTCKDRQLYNRFHNLCEKAGVKCREFHALRATCIKFHQDMGWTVDQTARLVDDTIQTIQTHYTVPSIEEMHQMAVDKEVY